MSIEIIAGLPGAGKTFMMKEIINNEIGNKNIYVFKNTREYNELLGKYKGNYVKASTHIEINLFEFIPGNFTSGKEYGELFEAHIQELMSFLLILLSRKQVGEEEKNGLKEAIYEFYESVGITDANYEPKVENVSSYLGFGLFIDFLKEKNEEMAENLNKCVFLFNGEQNISAIFQYEEQKPGDLSFNNSFNVIDIKENTSVFVLRDAVLYSYLLAVKRKVRISDKPMLLIIDEGQWIWLIEEWWFLDLITSNFCKVESDIQIKLVTQSISDLQKRVPNLIKNTQQFTLFRQSPREKDFLKTEFGLSKEDLSTCRELEVHKTFVIKKGYEKKAKAKRIVRKIDYSYRKMSFELKIRLMKLKYPKAGYYERMCLVGGYTKEQIQKMVEEAIKDGWIESNDFEGREEVCETEISYWE